MQTQTRLHVGNLSYQSTADDLTTLFKTVGTVVDSTVASFADTGRSRGFGFVQMSTEEEANRAIQQFDGYELMGRVIRVSKANPKPTRQLNNSQGRMTAEQRSTF